MQIDIDFDCKKICVVYGDPFLFPQVEGEICDSILGGKDLLVEQTVFGPFRSRAR